MSDSKDKQTVEIGTWVKIREANAPFEEVIQVVRPPEVNLMENKIPPDNVMAQALLGSHVGDKVAYQAPAGEIEIEILEVAAEELS
jgi:transcription elongation GreA/GreB family factor